LTLNLASNATNHISSSPPSARFFSHTDANGNPDQTAVDYVYDLVGKIRQVTDPTGVYSFAYDNMGRLIATTTQYSYLPGYNFQNSYTYDAASNRKSLTAPDGSTTTYNYDTLNRLSTLTNSLTGQFGFGYDALSRRTQLTRPNGINTNYSYDSVSHLLSVLHQSGSATVDGAGYTYDYAGNRTSKTNYLNGITSNYGYDLIYELTQVTQGGGTTESYSYDNVGNRLSSSGVPSYSYNTSNELTATSSGSYSYDANGNTLSDAQGRSFTWDFENRLTQAVNPGVGTTNFRYDPFGRRIQKSGPNGTTNYLYDGANLIEERDGAANVLARYTHGVVVDEDFAMLRNGTSSYYQQDGIGSITSLSNLSGALAETYAYDAFGKLTAFTGTLTNPFQYTGREFDSETELYSSRARYFDPNAARFLSQDPIRFNGGMNFYAYVRNNPAVFKDVFGLQGCNAAQWAQSPGACSGPQGPNGPYQGPDGLWYNVPDWHPTGITILSHTSVPESPPNDDDVLKPGNCECNLTRLLEWARDMQTEAVNEDERTFGFAWKTSLTLQGVEKALDHIGAEGAAEWIPGVDLFLIGHDYYEVWDHHHQVDEIIRGRFKECGSDW
jgi:RHS repeat-associated protein